MKRKLSPTKSIENLVKLLRAKPSPPASLADNELLRIIYDRRSVRSFTRQPIADDVFNAILEAGRLAPSTVNLQSWTFAIFDDNLWQQTFEHSIPFHANRAIIVIGDYHRYRTVLEDFPDCPLTEYTIAVINASLAAMNMNIAAEALGVSSVMLSETGRSGLLDAKYLREKMALPDGTVPLMTIVFGYASGHFHPMPPKLPMENITIPGQYQPTETTVMKSWLDQMIAGYNVSHLGSSFQKQLEIYQSKINRAETDLRELVFYKERP
ncbi:MAG: hypothetical protein HPY76_01535 [Anaerolineae bacterium]|jgi:nitroreductase|nr:hypothetical protein [Anaerolineae bacterium]